MLEVYASIYLPIKGWAAVCYGPHGPEYTGCGRATIYQAIQDALQIADDENCPIDIHGLQECPSCHGWMLYTETCDVCGYKSQYRIDLDAKILAMQARFAQT